MSRLNARLRRLEVGVQPANAACVVCGHGPTSCPAFAWRKRTRSSGQNCVIGAAGHWCFA
jgi:hypothetical protein